MFSYPVPKNEEDRLRVLHGLKIDFSVPMETLQNLAEIASEICQTPIALISLVDKDVQRFAANVGLPGVESAGRDISFCAHTIMGSDQLVVPDTTQDARFRDNPSVTGFGLRAYAGSVLEPEEDIRIGTVCVLDTRPRDFCPKVLRQLDHLAEAVTALLLAHRDRLALRDRLDMELEENDALRDIAARDPLTGLLNQLGFRNEVDAALRRSDGRETLAVIDVDHFKQVNDRWGHPFGDRYLKTLAEILPQSFGPGAIVGRIGGDEFAALLRPRDGDGPIAAIERARIAARDSAIARREASLGRLSVGLCSVTDAPRGTFEELYQRADVALYASKDNGRNTTTVFSQELDDLYNFRAQRTRFAQALDAGEVLPFFQPLVDLDNGRIEGFELLARWNDPRRGLLPPAYFHMLLMDQAIAPALTRRMIDGAMGALSAWQRQAALRVRLAINVTHHDLVDPCFMDQTEWRLLEAGHDWQDLTLEITERTILNDKDAEIRRSLNEIREKGGEVALDDFGTGHAGLLHLRDWPIDILKLDKAFVAGIDSNSRDEAIVCSMIDLAHRLDLRVVAEGIETAPVARRLKAAGCEMGQGFLFSKAVEQDAALKLLVDNRLHAKRFVAE